MNRILRLTSLLALVFLAQQGFSQLYTEDFGTAGTCADIDTIELTGTTADWDITFIGANSVDTTNRWFISSRESFTGLTNCGDGCLGGGDDNQTLHISTNQTTIDPGAVYENDSVANIVAWSPAISTFGAENIYVSFDYIEGGDTADNGTFHWALGAAGKASASPALAADLDKTFGSCGTDGTWSHYEGYLPTGAANQFELFLGFYFTSNGDGAGNNPSFAIDNIVVVDTTPDTDFDVVNSPVCVGDPVTFINNTSTLNPTYAWDFGSNATPSTSSNADPGNVVFNTAGTYVVTLTVTNQNGSTQATDTVEVVDCNPPTPNFVVSNNNICAGQCVNYFDNSIPGTFGTGDWNWQFQGGTPNISTAQNPQNICYPTPGTYGITMTVTDTITGLDSTIVYDSIITVGTCFVPTVTFDSDTQEICNNDFIQFYASSTGAPDSIRWIFDGGNPADTTGAYEDGDTINVFYPTPGVYTVICIVWNGAGTASDTIVDFITVLNCPTPIARFESNRKILCPGEVVVFQDNSQFATEWYWEFPGGQPSTSTDQFPVEIKYDEPGTYPVILIVKNVNGEDTLIAEEYITVDSCNNPLPRFNLEKDSICRGTCVQFFDNTKYVDITDSTDSIIWVFWWHPFPDSITGTAADTITASTPGYEWMLTALDSTFAEDTFLIWRDYFPMMPPVVDELDPIYCFDDSGTVGVQLFGYNEHGVGVLNRQDEAVLSIGGAYPKIKVGPDKTIRTDNIDSRFYLDDTVRFETTGTGPYWRWFPEEGLSCYDCPRPIVYPTETRKYYVTNFDDYGCQAYDSLVVFVEEAYYAGIPNIFSPNGDNNNDILWVRGNGIANDGFVFRIWNRYGEMIFESFSQNDGWDGTYKDIPAESGSYKYYVKLTFENGVVEELTGNVTIVRY